MTEQPGQPQPAPGSPEADQLTKEEAPQLPPSEENEPRRGVRLPIVLAVIAGIGVVVFLTYGRVPLPGAKSQMPSMPFIQTCSAIEMGMPAFDAREALIAAAQRDGMAGRPQIQMDGSKLTIAFNPVAMPAATHGCTIQLSGDGRSVASTRPFQQ